MWLPIHAWNGRLQGVGGGGYIVGLFSYMFIAMDAAIAEGYVAVGTKGGIYSTDINGGDVDTWALLEGGKINQHKLDDFAVTAISDMAMIGKKVLKMFYGEEPFYSYFSGYSNGGRQGYSLARHHPEAFDGIAACAPGLYWENNVENYWPGQLMNEEKEYPWPCEFEALSKAAVEACDKPDGVEDGILHDPDACEFDPKSMQGKLVECSDARKEVQISSMTVRIAQGLWQDKRPKGINFQGKATGYDADMKGSAGTTCTNGICVGNPDPLYTNWMRIFVKKDPSWDPSSMARKEFETLRQQSIKEYASGLGLANYDFSGFKKAGGKLLTYQGMPDTAISYKNTARFYDTQKRKDSSINNYFRLFMAPGLEHGLGGRGAHPHTIFHALVDWVEKGIAPDYLEATSQPNEAGESINGYYALILKNQCMTEKETIMILRVGYVFEPENLS